MSISSPVCSENNVDRRGLSSRKTTCTDERTTAIAVSFPLPFSPPLLRTKILLIYSRVLSGVWPAPRS